MSNNLFDEKQQTGSKARSVLGGLALVVLGVVLIGLTVAHSNWNVAVQYMCYASGVSMLCLGIYGGALEKH